MELSELIKMAAMQSYEASKPITLIEGEIAEVDPITIKFGEKLRLKKPNIVLAKGLDLEVGDKVLALRAEGGQRYYIICEVEE